MKTKLAIAGLIAALLVVAGLRLYGFYDAEKTSALGRARTSEAEAGKYKEERERIDAQQQCDTLWTQYHTAELQAENRRLDKQIASLRGEPGNHTEAAPVPIEPPCSGHEENLDETLEILKDQLATIDSEKAAANYAIAERDYAASRRLQTRYLGLRLWAFLTGTEPKKKPAELASEQEQRNTPTKPNLPAAEK